MEWEDRVREGEEEARKKGERAPQIPPHEPHRILIVCTSGISSSPLILLLYLLLRQNVRVEESYLKIQDVRFVSLSLFHTFQ